MSEPDPIGLQLLKVAHRLDLEAEGCPYREQQELKLLSAELFKLEAALPARLRGASRQR